MKTTSYILIFFIVCLPFVFILDYKVSSYINHVQNQEHYETLIDTAVYDTLNFIVELDDGEGAKINKEGILTNFYDSLFSNFGVRTNISEQSILKAYIPIVLVIEVDGININYSDIVIDNNVSSIKQLWTEKIKFIHKENNGAIYFQTNEDISVTVPGSSEVYKGNIYGIRDKYSTDTLFVNYYDSSSLSLISTNPTKFNELRLYIITKTVGDRLTYYVNAHNRVADSYGIKYRFIFPQSALDVFTRNIDNPGLMVLFQGYPTGTDATQVLNKVSFGGARSFKPSGFTVQQASDLFFYYHKETCSNLTISDEKYDTAKDAASSGAYPCLTCKP